MKKRTNKQMIYEMADSFISACAVGYVNAESAIHSLANFVLLSVKKINAFYTFCDLYISAAREIFFIRHKMKKLKSSAS